MSDYKVGDVVKLKGYEEIKDDENMVWQIKEYCGKEVTIHLIADCLAEERNYFETEDGKWCFYFEWIDSLVSIEASRPFIDITHTKTIKGAEPITKTIKLTYESSDKSEEQNLVDSARTLMKEFDEIRDDLKSLKVNLSISFDGDTGHGIIRAQKTIEL